jgi:hypothetical protein
MTLQIITYKSLLVVQRNQTIAFWVSRATSLTENLKTVTFFLRWLPLQPTPSPVTIREAQIFFTVRASVPRMRVLENTSFFQRTTHFKQLFQRNGG